MPRPVDPATTLRLNISALAVAVGNSSAVIRTIGVKSSAIKGLADRVEKLSSTNLAVTAAGLYFSLHFPVERSHPRVALPASVPKTVGTLRWHIIATGMRRVVQSVRS